MINECLCKPFRHGLRNPPSGNRLPHWAQDTPGGSCSCSQQPFQERASLCQRHQTPGCNPLARKRLCACRLASAPRFCRGDSSCQELGGPLELVVHATWPGRRQTETKGLHKHQGGDKGERHTAKNVGTCRMAIMLLTGAAHEAGSSAGCRACSCDGWARRRRRHRTLLRTP